MVERTADQRIRTTEWEDVQYKFGNNVGKYATHELEILAQRIADGNVDTCLKVHDASEEKVRDKLERGGYDVDMDGDAIVTAEAVADTHEHMDDFDDDDALARYRQKRLAQLKAAQQAQCFGSLRSVDADAYVEEVTEASRKSWVVAVLVKPGHSECEAFLTVCRTAAQRNREVKFVSMVAIDVVKRFPDGRLPCVLLYKDGVLQHQICELLPWKLNRHLTLESVERVLQRHKVLHREEYADDDDDG